MPRIKVGNESVESIDAKKRALEAKSISNFKRIFNNIADDVVAIYEATGDLRAEEVAENYRTEFIKEIRDVMRKTIKSFGFQIRSTLEEKCDLLFGVENKILEIELDFKRVEEIEENETTDVKLDAINRSFLLAASLFVANESEDQAKLITETNSNEIVGAFGVAAALYADELRRTRESGNQDKVSKLIRSQRSFIAESAKKDIVKKGINRSELIASQNVGLTESWSRQEEAKLVNDAELVASTQKVVRIKKAWRAVLDDKTRSSHVNADGQTVGINDNYIVNGENLRYPRDPNGSLENIIRCRCQSEHEII